MSDKVTLQELQAMKERGEPITMLTVYDYPTAQIIDRAGIVRMAYAAQLVAEGHTRKALDVVRAIRGGPATA